MDDKIKRLSDQLADARSHLESCRAELRRQTTYKEQYKIRAERLQEKKRK